MASNSKKRRRVLGASCILAALIIASSSFAWFTSSDEVTNRLSANADYGVKIVESFAPPANWLPGQKVNKDVYATNTGTVEAFVKETISGVLTINNEKAVDAATGGKPTANSKELTEEERYAIEAGAFLAYKPEGDTKNERGDQIVTRYDDLEWVDPNDHSQGKKAEFDFTPAAEGLYVFRRSIDVNNVDNTAATGVDGADAGRNDGKGAEVFTYDAYYFVPAKAETSSGAGDGVPAKYYKVSNLDVTEDTIADFAGDGKNTDGYVTAAVGSYGFYEDVTDIAKNVDLTYRNFTTSADDKKELKAAGLLDASGNEITGQYLIATYDTGTNTGVNLNADYEAAAKALDDARHEYELAVELQTKAANESASADNTLQSDITTLNQEKQDLIDALEAQAEAAQALATAQAKYDKLTTEKANLTARKEALEREMYGHVGGGTNAVGTGANQYDSTSLYADSQKSLPAAYADAHSHLMTEIDAWLATNPTGVTHTTFATLTYDELLKFTPSSETHDYYEKYVARKLAEEKYTALSTEYSAVTSRIAALGSDTEAGEIKNAYDDINTAGTGKKALKEKADQDVRNAETDYNNAYNTFRTDLAAAGTATTNLDTADARVASARTKYLAALSDFNALDAAGKHYAYDAGVLKIYIKLDDANVITENDGSSNAKWQMLPTPIYKEQEAVFYYTGLLEGGETSTKLVDFVALDARTTQNMYKNFDFDLNVDLDSVQATQDENGRYVATSANDHFGADDDAAIDGANVVIKTPTDVNTPLVWNFDAHA